MCNSNLRCCQPGSTSHSRLHKLEASMYHVYMSTLPFYKPYVTATICSGISWKALGSCFIDTNVHYLLYFSGYTIDMTFDYHTKFRMDDFFLQIGQD